MPRQNRPRTIGQEEGLARRIGYEREQRGWSYAGLASRMTRAGCAIDQSALYKIENATPRRPAAASWSTTSAGLAPG